MFELSRIASIRDFETRSVSAENPTGAPGMGALANVGDDHHTAQAARELGRGWKVRPCLRIAPGETETLADIEGPGVIQHIWMTVDPARARLFTLRAYYDDLDEPSIECPVSDFFASGIDGRAKIVSIPIAVNPTGGMNSYWPMPFRRRVRFTITNDWDSPHPGHPENPREEFFYQITWSREPVAHDAAYLHTQWRRTVTAPERPEFVILDGARGPGQYVGTSLIWRQFVEGWWGEGEVKFFVDGDGKEEGTKARSPQATRRGERHEGTKRGPTICGTGTEDYFGGAWGFEERDARGVSRPVNYSGPFLGYPQIVRGESALATHLLYRWHIPDPIRFRESLRVTCQALGWKPGGVYRPLEDDIISMAWWYQREARGVGERLPDARGRLIDM